MDDSTGGFDSTERETQDTGMEPGSGTDTGLDPTKEHDRKSGGMDGAGGDATDPAEGGGGDASDASEASRRDAHGDAADPL